MEGSMSAATITPRQAYRRLRILVKAVEKARPLPRPWWKYYADIPGITLCAIKLIKAGKISQAYEQMNHIELLLWMRDIDPLNSLPSSMSEFALSHIENLHRAA